MTKSIKEKIAGAKARTETVKVCLRGDLAEQHADLVRQLNAVEADTPGMLNSPNTGRRRDLAEQIRQVEAEMAEYEVAFRVHAIGYEWAELIAQHPPREGVAEQANSLTFLPAAIRACVFDPELDEEDWAQLIGPGGALNDGDIGRLYDAALTVNRRTVSVPFSSAASAVTGTS